MTLPTNWVDDALAVYLAFCSLGGERTTNSTYLINKAYEGGGSESTDEDGGGGNPFG